ncbi:MAG: hypothetical protein PVH21_10170 [Myxococcales bacterium]|jgi:hypothetical protein
MTTEIRDPQFASYVDAIAESIRWPSQSFRLSVWETLVGAVVAFYHAASAPNPVVLQAALRGIAF